MDVLTPFLGSPLASLSLSLSLSRLSPLDKETLASRLAFLLAGVFQQNIKVLPAYNK
jgi:hypothetical protein